MKSGECVIRDDANSITEQIKQADVIVWATPIYYYEKSGQMKVMIDRANSLYETDYQFRDVYLLSTAAENEDGVDHRALNGLKGWVACYPKSHFVFGSSCFGRIKFKTIAEIVARTTGDFPKIVVTQSGNCARDALA